MRTKNVLLSAAVAMAILSGRVNAEDMKAVDVPAGDLTVALEALAKQTGVEFVYQMEELKGVQTKGAHGQLTAEGAVKKLLEGTKLVVTVHESGAVLIGVPGSVSQVVADSGFDLRLTQADAPTPPAQDTEYPQTSKFSETTSSSDSNSNKSEKERIEEIVVTGTHIRGTSPVGSSLIVIDRKEILASGHGRIQEVFEDLTQNFSGSASEDSVTDYTTANRARGQAIDLRGLGASSTLVLVNGRRQAAGGMEGAFADISSIATSAIERIEILTDGASALYGSDAIAGVVNFVLRKDYEGFETNVRVATSDGGAKDLQASQLWGRHWTRGRILTGYQYSHRDAFMVKDTPYGSLNWDMRALGGSDFRSIRGNPGTILDPQSGLPAYAIPEGQNGTNLSVGDLLAGQANYLDTVSDVTWLPQQIHHSGFVTVSQGINETFELFGEARFSHRETNLATWPAEVIVAVPQSNPFYVDPFGSAEPVLIATNLQELGPLQQRARTRTYALTAGAAAHLGREWGLNLAATYAHEENQWRYLNDYSGIRLATALADSDPTTALNLFGDATGNNQATMDFIRSTQTSRGLSQIGSLSAIADGPLFQLPAGLVRLALGLDYRNERVNGNRRSIVPATGVATPETSYVLGSMQRTVKAVFGEMVVPFLADPEIKVSLAARHEDYSDFGETTDPKIGLSLKPIAGLELRASWGSSFRAPRFNELSPSSNPPFVISDLAYMSDPLSPTGFSNTISLGGNNENLKPETADVWTAGLEFTPARVSGLSMAVTYFNIDYKDKIQYGGAGALTLQDEGRWQEIITRNPTQAQIDAVCNLPGVQYYGTCPPPNVAAIIDTRLRNIGGVRIRGIDFDVGYRWGARIGDWMIRMGGTRLSSYETAVSSSSHYVDDLNHLEKPIDLRLRARLGWNMREWAANATVNYAGDYRNQYDPAVPDRHVGSWTTVDIAVGYRLSASSGWFSGSRLQLAANNAFDEKPPFVNQSAGFDLANASGIGRTLSFSISREW